MYDKTKNIILIFLSIFILTHFLQYIYYYQIKDDDRLITTNILIDHHDSRCFYVGWKKTNVFSPWVPLVLLKREKMGVVIKDCQQYRLGTLLEVVSKASATSAKNLSSLKMLTNPVIVSKKTSQVSFFIRLRAKLAHYLVSLLGSPEGEVVFSLMFGDRRLLPQEIRSQLNILGLNHLLAVSGLHLTILASLVWFMINQSALNRLFKLIVFSFFLIFYINLNLFYPAVTRAGLMILVLFWTRFYFFVSYRSWWSLLMVFLFLVSLDPLAIKNISFQFSFLATTWIILLMSKHRLLDLVSLEAVEGILFQSKKESQTLVKRLKDYFVSSIRLSVFVNLGLLPLTIYYFQGFSLWSFVSTSVFVWFLPIVFVLGLVLLGLYPLLFLGKVGWLILTVTSFWLRWLVELMIWLMGFLSKLDGFYFQGLTISLSGVIAYYFFWLTAIIWYRRRIYEKT